MKVLTFSRQFPKKHPKAGFPTLFVQRIWKGLPISAEYSIYIKLPKLLKSGRWQVPVTWRDLMHNKKFTPKLHTIRVGKRWKVGDMASLRVWSKKPYRSKQIEFAQVKITKIYDVLIESPGPQILILIPKKRKTYTILSAFDVAKNDGLNVHDFIDWFKVHPKKKGKVFIGQIICWSDKVKY